MSIASVRSFKLRWLAALLLATSLASGGQIGHSAPADRIVGEDPIAGVLRMSVKIGGIESPDGTWHFSKNRKEPTTVLVNYTLRNPFIKPMTFDVIVTSSSARATETPTLRYGTADFATRLQTIPTDPTKVTVLEIAVAAQPKTRGLPLFLQKPQKKRVTIVFDK